MKTTHHIVITKFFALGLLLWAFSFTSCKKFVQIGPPTTKIATASVFNSDGTATAAQLAIYTNMWSNSESSFMAQAGGLLSDELSNTSTTTLNVQYYTNSMAATTASTGPWTRAYPYIYQANTIIEALQGNKSISPPVAQQLIGESLFIRAFWHFYLTNVYGDVPLVTTTDYTKNGSLARTPQATVYQQVIADLQSAQRLLNSNYVDASDTTVTTDRVRPTKAAATALLARVYLYTQQYALAEAQATAVISNPLYSLCPNLSGASNSVFLANSSEAIWQLATPMPATYNTKDGLDFILVSAPGTGGVQSATISPQLLGSFEAGDKRLAQWIGVYNASPTVKYTFPYKYQSYSSATIKEYTMVLRLAEQYLIRAEGEAQEGKLTNAISDLNVIRSRAGLPNTTATTQAQLLTAILHERQVELFAEWGHRWFDLKRTGNLDAAMGGPMGVCQSKGGIWVPTDQLFPVPQSERNNDANLTQNAGY